MKKFGFSQLFIYTYSMKHLVNILWLLAFVTLNVAAQEGVPAVKEDAFLVQKEIQIWRTDLAASSKLPIYHCQAVQLDPHWFLTAAHCVYPACNGSLPCTVQITLAQGELRKQVRVYHSNNTQNVFIYPGFFPGQNRISSVDIALIRLNPQEATFSHTVFQEGQWITVSPEQFAKLLKFSPETKAQLATRRVRLISSANLPNSRFLPSIVVPKVQEGALSYLISSSPHTYFVAALQHFIAPDFGVRRGNSGGGVFTANGDLVGLVSSLLFSQDGSASFQDDDGNTVLTLRNANEYFLFTGFNGSTLNFVRNRMAHVRTVGALNGFAEPTKKDFKAMTKSISNTPMTF